MNRELNRISTLIGVSRALVIEGNINDIFNYEREYLNVSQILERIGINNEFDNTFTFDAGSGLSGINLDEIRKICEENKIQIKDGDGTNNVGSLQFLNYSDFFRLLKILMTKNLKRNLVLINYSNLIFSETNLDPNDRKSLIDFFKAINEKKFSIGDIDKRTSTVVFLTEKVTQIPPIAYVNNPDIIVTSLTKPSIKEREEFINSIKARIKILFFDKNLNTLVDATDGWTLKDIMKFAKFTCNYKDELELNSALSIFNYGEKKSPWEELSYEKMKSANEFLKANVIGQNEAINKVLKVLYKAYTGLTGVSYSEKKSKPKGTLFFVGPTGTGKTELAKSITKFLFNDETNLIRFDMSEYSQDHADQKLIGAPPGYVGFENGGQLTNAIKEKPFSVLLFDEIEKAHPSILDKFLQILEDGRLTDNIGQTISFSETFIIFTSNIGASTVDPNKSEEEVYKSFIYEVQNHFTNNLNRPELLGRLGNNIVPFNFIKSQELKAALIKQKLRPIAKVILDKYGAKLNFDWGTEFLKIVTKSADERRGGRDIVNSLETNLVDPLSEFIFENLEKIKQGVTILAAPGNGKLSFKVTNG